MEPGWVVFCDHGVDLHGRDGTGVPECHLCWCMWHGRHGRWDSILPLTWHFNGSPKPKTLLPRRAVLGPQRKIPERLTVKDKTCRSAMVRQGQATQTLEEHPLTINRVTAAAGGMCAGSDALWCQSIATARTKVDVSPYGTWVGARSAPADREVPHALKGEPDRSPDRPHEPSHCGTLAVVHRRTHIEGYSGGCVEVQGDYG
jgi:hypothetical protein